MGSLLCQNEARRLVHLVPCVSSDYSTVFGEGSDRRCGAVHYPVVVAVDFTEVRTVPAHAQLTFEYGTFVEIVNHHIVLRATPYNDILALVDCILHITEQCAVVHCDEYLSRKFVRTECAPFIFTGEPVNLLLASVAQCEEVVFIHVRIDEVSAILSAKDFLGRLFKAHAYNLSVSERFLDFRIGRRSVLGDEHVAVTAVSGNDIVTVDMYVLASSELLLESVVCIGLRIPYVIPVNSSSPCDFAFWTVCELWCERKDASVAAAFPVKPELVLREVAEFQVSY